MLGVVAADQHQPAAAVDASGINNSQPRLPSTRATAQTVGAEAAYQPSGDSDQGQHQLTLSLENITDKGYRVLGSGVDGVGFNAVFGYQCAL